MKFTKIKKKNYLPPFSNSLMVKAIAIANIWTFLLGVHSLCMVFMLQIYPQGSTVKASQVELRPALAVLEVLLVGLLKRDCLGSHQVSKQTIMMSM